jgi:hypothetical protein
MATITPRALATTAKAAMASCTVPVDTTTTAAGLPHGELRLFPFGYVSLGTRQRRADERPMHGAVVVADGRFVVFGNHVSERHCILERLEVEIVRKIRSFGQVLLHRRGGSRQISRANGAWTLRRI